MTQTGDDPREQPARDPDQESGGRREPEDRAVPGVGGAAESSADGQQGLRLHIGVATIATVLSVLVAVVFARMGSWPLTVVFAVVALASLGALDWARRHKRRGAHLRADRRRAVATPPDPAGRS